MSTMQMKGDWRAAVNLALILGKDHPPAQIERPFLPPPQHRQPLNGSTPATLVNVDARNTASFRTSSYCGVQDRSSATVRHHLISYYRAMLQRVPIWQYGSKTAVKANLDDSAAVKTEAGDGDANAMESPVLQSSPSPVHDGSGLAPAAAASPSAGVDSSTLSNRYRALGILTQVHDPSGTTEATQMPWELFIIRDIYDDSCYDAALRALTVPVALPAALRHLIDQQSATQRSSSNGGGTGDHLTLGIAGEDGEDEAAAAAAVQGGARLALYTRMLEKFTGIYQGMAIGVIGDPFQRNSQGILIGLLVQDFILPRPPSLPWRLSNSVFAPPSSSGLPGGVRLHFCSGPYPRRDTRALIKTVTTQALQRTADVLIFGGPFIKPFEDDFEQSLLPALGATFAEVMETFVDTLEETLSDYYATRPLVPHLKVILVSHREDVMQVPVLPTTMYPIADTADILMRSNPCRISVNGIHVGVCNEDVVGIMRDRMVERWPYAEGSLRRVVETLVNSRLFTPLYSLPSPLIDLKHLPLLQLDFVPERNELLDFGNTGSPSRGNTPSMGDNWSTLLNLGRGDSRDTHGDLSHEPLKSEENRKRVKLESAQEAAVTSQLPINCNAAEMMPHILFLPSTRPQFATVTHQNEEEDGTDIDNIATASGVLVVNQEVWSRRSSPKFQLRVAEVTIPNPEVVVRRGASAANGVACGILHIFSAA